jgi:hypothetical protein
LAIFPSDADSRKAVCCTLLGGYHRHALSVSRNHCTKKASATINAADQVYSM